VKPELSFYDVKTKSKFPSSEWRIEVKESKGKMRYFAVSKVPGQPHEASVVRVAVGLALSAGVAHAGGDPVDGQKQRIVQSLIFLAPAQASENLHLH